MDTMLTIILIGVAAGLVMSILRPAPRTQIVYVPVEVAAERGGLGCLPLIVVGIVLLLGLELVRI